MSATHRQPDPGYSSAELRNEGERVARKMRRVGLLLFFPQVKEVNYLGRLLT